MQGKSFSHLKMFSLPPVSLLLAGRVLPIQHKRKHRDSEPLVEMWPAELPFWWDEMHGINFLDLLFPPSHLIGQLSNTGGTCSQAVLLSTLRHVWSDRLGSSSFPQFIPITEHQKYRPAAVWRNSMNTEAEIKERQTFLHELTRSVWFNLMLYCVHFHVSELYFQVKIKSSITIHLAHS